MSQYFSYSEFGWNPSNYQLDKIRGCLWGSVLGDVLGHPYEFSSIKEYSDQIIQNGHMKLGTVSDDTEMMLSLFRSIVNIDNKVSFSKDVTILNYTLWANSGPWDIGINTRNLFLNPPEKYSLHYNHAMKIIKDKPSSTWSQSNGCLMRCTPLILFSYDKYMWREDCILSNPHHICIEASDLYFQMLFMILGVIPFKQLSLEWSTTPVVQEAITQVLNDEKRDVSKMRGWVIHGLYFAFMMFYKNFETFSDGMRAVIGDNLDSDTDTNAAIAGGILGCKLGFKQMNEEKVTKKNLKIIKSCKNDRTEKYPSYHPENIDKLLGKLFPSGKFF